MVVDPNRTIRFCSPAVEDVFGHQVTDVIGRKTDLLYHDRRTVKDGHEIYEHLERFGFHIGSATGRHKDGAAVPLEIVTSKLRNRAGAVVLARDISERKRVEELREDLLHMIVHDLKSPLSTISLSLQVMQRSAQQESKEEERDRLGEALKLTDRLGEMIQSLLDTNRLERGDLHLNSIRDDLVPLAKEVADTFICDAEDKGVSVCLPSKSTLGYCDRELIRRVLTNLVGNAMKFTQRGGEIRIEMENEGDATRVSVTDTGPGIPQKYHEKIFERFGQAEVKEFSTGLGLTFCKLAVEAHGGSISVESEVGKGSTFSFVLPASHSRAVDA